MNKHYELAERLGTLLLEKRLKVSAAESCTGGGVCTAITDISGSSQWFDGGVVTYSNRLKFKLLQVSEHTLSQFGAVSHEVVKEMLSGVLKVSGADLAVAISGIAGPTGAMKDKPVGTVCFAVGNETSQKVFTEIFSGNRIEVRSKATESALESLIAFCDDNY